MNDELIAIRDNLNDLRWPVRVIDTVKQVRNNLDDRSHCEHTTLECGHEVYHTYDETQDSYLFLPTLRCRTCWSINQ